MDDAAPPRNRLAGEPSPYLRQHATNPVRWYPWGAESFARAQAEGKPVLLSIGYSACHWCHVMERETFADPEVGAFLDQHFIAIKVDREERPDVDAVYMAAVQALTGSGGWPLTVFLTPQGEPFFGGTYFPPERRWGRPSFREVAEGVVRAWREQRSHLEAGARELTRRLAVLEGTPSPAATDVGSAVEAALAQLAASFDREFGGFGSAPKFPSPSRLFFLLDLAPGHRTAREMLATTLDGMAAGGMYDWVGGGFHRYSVDRGWLVPHFEKMLYDNALLARLYAQAGLHLDNPRWVEVACETADYLLREMQGPEGGFFSSTDADSEGEEGLFFTWTPAEVREVLPAAAAESIVALCALNGPPNFEGGRSVLRPRGGVAGDEPQLRAARQQLLAARSRRVPPALDDKRLAGWNGMAMWSLAFLGRALDVPRYLEAAQRAAAFVEAHLIGADGRIARSWREGVHSGAETLEDVAWLSAGFVELYETTGRSSYLEVAARLLRHRLPHYLDAAGGVFSTPDDGEALCLRPRELVDGATPAPAGVLAATLARLASLTDSTEFRTLASRLVAAVGTLLAQVPEACSSLLAAARVLERPPVTVAVLGEWSWPATAALHRAALCSRPPGAVVAVAAHPHEAGLAAPLFQGKSAAAEGVALAFVCRGGSCLAPVAEGAILKEVLREP